MGISYRRMDDTILAGIDDVFSEGTRRHIVHCAEEWAKKSGLRQIRTHHNDKAIEAINMSYALGYGMCPHEYHEDEGCSGYYVAKVLSD